MWLNPVTGVLLPLISIALKPIKTEPVPELSRVTGFIKLVQYLTNSDSMNKIVSSVAAKA